MNYFEYKGVRSSDIGIRIQKKDVFSTPAYDMTFTSVPGRSGDLIMPNGRYPNVQVSYSVYIPAKTTQDLADVLRRIKAWLFTGAEKYHILSDTYDLDFFRYGVFASKLDVDDEAGKIGVFTISFSCKPFKYSFSGQRETEITASPTEIINPYSFAAKPLYRLYGNGTCALSLTSDEYTNTWTFQNVEGYVDIDCEQMNFYKGPVLKNSTVTGSGFPDLEPGRTQIALGGGSTSISVKPRWMTL